MQVTSTEISWGIFLGLCLITALAFVICLIIGIILKKKNSKKSKIFFICSLISLVISIGAFIGQNAMLDKMPDYMDTLNEIQQSTVDESADTINDQAE